jgi:hypothetical protein
MSNRKHGVVLIDCLHNLTQSSGASNEYCKGLLVGLVSGLMADGDSFDYAIRTVAEHMPKSHRALADCTPECWVNDLQRYDTQTLYTRK